MNWRIVRSITKVTLLAVTLGATLLFASAANAQFSTVEGRFTLPYEAHWGHAVLPPGNYQLTFTDNNTSPMLVIRDTKNLRVVAFEPIQNREGSKGESALLIASRGKQHVVQSLRIAELGEAFVYERQPAPGRTAEEARNTEAVPVIVAKK